MRGYIIILIALGISLQLYSQGSFRNDIYNCFVMGDMEKWEKTVSNYSFQENDLEFSYEYALAYYGIVGYYVRNGLRKEGRKYLSDLYIINDKLLDSNPDDPRFLALKGAVYGFEMFFNRHKIFSVGPKSIKTINRAIELGPEEPHALVEEGNKTFHMPKFLGGSREEAINIYHKAIRNMEKDPSFIKDNWFYLNSLTVLASYYEQVGLTNRARGLYLKLNKIEPEYDIIKIRIQSLSY